jgi:molybdenum cofactor guanylyltransferase
MSTTGVPGAILAGGQSRRMGGGDKALLDVGGRSLLARVVDRIAPQCDGLVLNANGDPGRFASFGLPVVDDAVPGHAGPLAGVLAVLDWAAAHRPGVERVLTVPADCPFLPRDLVQRLDAARRGAGADIACAASGGRTHPVIALWPVATRDALRRALTDEGLRKVGLWTARHATVSVAWDDTPADPFFNANAPEDLAEARRLAEAFPDL